MTKSSVTPRPGGRTARVTRQVEEVTARILLEKGYDGLTFKEVAEAAGINRSTLYRRWPNRAQMVLATITQIVRDRVFFEDTGSLTGDLRVVLLRIGEFISSPIGKAILIATLDMQQKGELTFDDGLSWAERARDVLPVFQRAKSRGELPADFDAEGTFAMLSGALYFRLIVMRGPPDEAWVDRILAIFQKEIPGRNSQNSTTN